ncbi:hypothetical protein LX59_01122 [Azomonas agilis]|uniref:Uncharacterized protein n=1 Tax=Azomonas agilis TaxID=116849 RepID=A0A562IYS8_9GAMM|nr:hypothetical protein [Azomonas agilis]TWH76201.1 hypothetical protein LX59_01122 [Azomonas agilis]
MHEHEEDELFAKDRLIEAIENQLASGEPACTQAVFNKLSLVGYERTEILELMALVLGHEICSLLHEERGFDVQRYEQLLRQLPELPPETP